EKQIGTPHCECRDDQCDHDDLMTRHSPIARLGEVVVTEPSSYAPTPTFGPHASSFGFLGALAHAFRNSKEQRNDENPNQRSSNHAAEHRRADRATGHCAGALGNNKGEESEDEREACHHYWTKP